MKTFARFRRFTISLRVLMGLVIIFAFGLARVVNRANTQREAVAAITKAGGEALYEYACLDGGYIMIPQRGPAWLRRALGRDYIDRVSVVNFEPSSDPVSLIKSSIPYLLQLDSLEILTVIDAGLDNEGLLQLSRLTTLKHLDIINDSIDDRGLARLNQLDRLEYLRLTGNQVTDQGLSRLLYMTSLKSIDLNGTKVTDQALEHLLSMTSLKTINLANTKVSEAGVEKLSRLSKCNWIGLELTSIPTEAIRRLRKKYPHIHYEAPP